MTLNYKEITKISDIKKFVDYTHKTLKIDWHPDDGFMTIAEDDTSQYISYDLRRSLENRLEEIYKIIDDKNNSFSYNKLCDLLITSIDKIYMEIKTA